MRQVDGLAQPQAQPALQLGPVRGQPEADLDDRAGLDHRAQEVRHPRRSGLHDEGVFARGELDDVGAGLRRPGGRPAAFGVEADMPGLGQQALREHAPRRTVEQMDLAGRQGRVDRQDGDLFAGGPFTRFDRQGTLHHRGMPAAPSAPAGCPTRTARSPAAAPTASHWSW
jgi:hypothetical protein